MLKCWQKLDTWWSTSIEHFFYQPKIIYIDQSLIRQPTLPFSVLKRQLSKEDGRLLWRWVDSLNFQLMVTQLSHLSQNFVLINISAKYHQILLHYGIFWSPLRDNLSQLESDYLTQVMTWLKLTWVDSTQLPTLVRNENTTMNPV